MYEIATPGFIIEAVETKAVHITLGTSSVLSDTFTIPQEIWTSVSYEDAKPLSLKHALLLGEDLLKSEAGGIGGFKTGQRDPIAIADNMLLEDFRDIGSLALLLLELAAVETGSTEALKRAIRHLLGKSCDGVLESTAG